MCPLLMLFYLSLAVRLLGIVSVFVFLTLEWHKNTHTPTHTHRHTHTQSCEFSNTFLCLDSLKCQAERRLP